MREQFTSMFRGNKQRRRSQPLFISIFCLLVLILVCSMFFILKGNNNGSPAGRHHTSTVTATTPALTSTITASPTPLFFENFADNSKGWSETSPSSDSDYTRTRSKNLLTLSVTNHKPLVESLPTSTVFSDFTITMTFTLLKGDANDSVGLYLRGDSNLDHDYRIDIFGDKTVSIGKEVLSSQGVEEIAAFAPFNHIYVNQLQHEKNTLTVTMKGPILILSINDKQVGSVTDSDYQSGQISLFVQNGSTSNRATASFSSIKIDPAPVILPLTPTPTPK